MTPNLNLKKSGKKNQESQEVVKFWENYNQFIIKIKNLCKMIPSNASNLELTKQLDESLNNMHAWQEGKEIDPRSMMKKIIILLDRVLDANRGLEGQISPLIREAKEIKQSIASLFLKRYIREWVESIIIAFILAMVIRTFVVQAFKIPTGSMRTTLLEGDLILVNKFIYGAKIPFTDFSLPAVRQPKRGDVIVFIYPQSPQKDFIKRLVGLPGETVQIKDGTIYINDRPLLDPVFNQRYYYNRGEFMQEGKQVKVPKDSFFVLGDNSASSQDSRYWGFVPRKNILGEAIVVYWPPQRIRVIK